MFTRRCRRDGAGHDPLHPPLDQQLDVRPAHLELPEAVHERVLEAVEMEVLRAARVGAVEKGAMIASGCHRSSLTPSINRPPLLSAGAGANRESRTSQRLKLFRDALGLRCFG